MSSTLSNTQIRDKFNQAFNGQGNFVTPNPVKFGQRGDFIYEISSGRGMDNRPIFGVTVIHRETLENTDYSTGVFNSLPEAEQYISSTFNKQ